MLRTNSRSSHLPADSRPTAGHHGFVCPGDDDTLHLCSSPRYVVCAVMIFFHLFLYLLDVYIYIYVNKQTESDVCVIKSFLCLLELRFFFFSFFLNLSGSFYPVLMCTLQYYFMLPTLLNTFLIFAFCNTHDLSWGTKGTMMIVNA
jgi:cellulose synthase/poly-beta-1,6-N-acetylglucosamine synthase-like glycosyltransferase